MTQKNQKYKYPGVVIPCNAV